MQARQEWGARSEGDGKQGQQGIGHGGHLGGGDRHGRPSREGRHFTRMRRLQRRPASADYSVIATACS
jgi:hypothetical protein